MSASAPTALARVGLVVQRIEEVLLGGAILGIASSTIANVVARALFDHSFAGAQELNRHLMIVVTFVGVGYAAGRGRHIRMSALYDLLSPERRRLARAFICATTAALLFALAWLGVSHALGTVRVLGTRSPALGIPLWMIDLCAPLGLSLGGVQYVLGALANLFGDRPYLAPGVTDELEELEELGASEARR